MLKGEGIENRGAGRERLEGTEGKGTAMKESEGSGKEEEGKGM